MLRRKEPIKVALKRDSDVPSEMVRSRVEVARHRIELSVTYVPSGTYDITDVRSDAIVLPGNSLLTFDDYNHLHSIIAARAGMSLFAQAATKAEEQFSKGYNFSIQVPVISLDPQSTTDAQREHTVYLLPFALALSTHAGRLRPQKGIIHVNTSGWSLPSRSHVPIEALAQYLDDVRRSVLSAMRVADENGFRSITLPELAAQMGYTAGPGWPQSLAVTFKGCILGIQDFLEMKPDTSVKKVGIVWTNLGAWPQTREAHRLREMLIQAMRDPHLQ